MNYETRQRVGIGIIGQRVMTSVSVAANKVSECVKPCQVSVTSTSVYFQIRFRKEQPSHHFSIQYNPLIAISISCQVPLLSLLSLHVRFTAGRIWLRSPLRQLGYERHIKSLPIVCCCDVASSHFPALILSVLVLHPFLLLLSLEHHCGSNLNAENAPQAPLQTILAHHSHVHRTCCTRVVTSAPLS